MVGSRHALRIALLMVASALFLAWALRHTEANFADGLRYIRRAERMEREGLWAGLAHGVDHPLHPLLIAATHRILGGTDPESWQHAALVLCFACAVLLIIPVYLLTLELLGEHPAWMASVLVILNPIIGYIVVNVLSECTFLLPWMFGLWCAVRFLREGRFGWLPLAAVLSAAAYLTRPEGMLLPLALGLTLLILPCLPATRVNWPRWWAAVAFLYGGLIVLAGPYVVYKGGLGTKPGVARVLGLAAAPDALGLEREKPIQPGQTTLETYRLAAIRAFKVFRAAVTPPLFPLAILGVIAAWWIPSRARAWLFLSIMLAASWLALVRLHAVAGYCTVRHGLIPGLILTLAAAHGTTWLMSKISIPGRWFGLGQERLRPGPAVWALLIAVFIALPIFRSKGSLNPGPFAAYHQAGAWIASHTSKDESLLDLTDWSTYFSGRSAYVFADVYRAPQDPRLRWVVVRKPHIEGHWYYSGVVRALIGGREPVMVLPQGVDNRQVQIRIYDRSTPAPIATAGAGERGEPRSIR